MDAVMVTVMQIHLTQPLPGDILVFLTGEALLYITGTLVNLHCRVEGHTAISNASLSCWSKRKDLRFLGGHVTNCTVKAFI